METTLGDERLFGATGGCLCGAVRYEVRGNLSKVVNCHCTQCRRTSGHFVAAASVDPDDLILLESRGLRWYQSSEKARRGFCSACGSSLFWDPTFEEPISIMAGTLDTPTGLETAAQIYVEDAGDYYEVGEELPASADDSAAELA